MRKAALLYNPVSGGSRKRQGELEAALAILRNAGVEASLLPTDSPDHAGEEARRVVADGCDTIFACGGDGTIHNIAQVLANTPVALAVLPMGTANALAHDLGLPMSVPAAAKAALTGFPRRIALGHIDYLNLKNEVSSCYFVIAAGVGVDAHLFYQLRSEFKQRMGMAAYYAKAWHLWFSYPMTRFDAKYLDTDSSAGVASVTEVLGVRIRNFGGVLRELAPGASLDRDDIRLILCRTAKRWAYLAYVTRGLLGARWSVPGIDVVSATVVGCFYPSEGEMPSHPQGQTPIYVEADGELIGTLPAKMSIVPNALTVLAPAR